MAGRISAAALSVVAVVGERPRAPEDFSEEQALEWRAIVERMPPGFFTREMWGVLEQLCRHIANSRLMGLELTKFNSEMLEDRECFRRYEKLITMHQKEGAAIASLSTKLRLTAQSRYDEKSAHTALVKNGAAQSPWEISGR